VRTKYAARILRSELDPEKLAKAIISMGKTVYTKAHEFNKRAGLYQNDDKEVQKLLSKMHFGQRKETIQPRLVLTRKIARNRQKLQLGTNKIQKAWQKIQVKRLGGIKQYIAMRISKKRRGEHLDITLA
jgi:hypothetical protein